MEPDKISIYMPTHNRSEILSRAIESVLKQSYKNIEIIIVNDGSTDSTKTVLDVYDNKDPRVVVINNYPAKGACFSRNCAIMRASGKFIIGIDDDDEFYDEDVLQKFVEYWGTSSEKVVGLYSNLIIKKAYSEDSAILNNKCYIDNILKENSIGSYLFSELTTFKMAGLFDVHMPAWQDWDLWVRILRNNPNHIFENIGVFGYIIHEDHIMPRITYQSDNIKRVALERFFNKNKDISFKNKSRILINSFYRINYDVRLSDLIVFLFAGEPRNLIRHSFAFAKKTLLNISSGKQVNNENLNLFDGDDSLFKRILADCRVYGEYGCGSSTKWVLENTQAIIYSVDTSFEWAKKIKEESGSNKRLNLDFIDLGDVGDWGRPLSYKKISDFHLYTDSFWDKSFPDVVLIDGRFRVACFLTCLLKAKAGTKILFDDYVNRQYYHFVEKYVDRYETFGRMCLFIVPEINEETNVSIESDLVTFRNVID